LEQLDIASFSNSPGVCFLVRHDDDDDDDDDGGGDDDDLTIKPSVIRTTSDMGEMH
jgi:hypothetical protein